jgi:hypothetical protein
VSDEPIDPQNYGSGLTVVDIGDLRVARGQTRRPRSTCRHRNLAYDSQERRVYCHDCEQDVDPFDAFVGLCEGWDSAAKKLNRRAQALAESESFTLRRRAAKVMDEAWRKKNSVPGCPHCKEGLLPEDILASRLPWVSKRITEEKRKKK